MSTTARAPLGRRFRPGPARRPRDRGCGRRTTAASRRGCSACWSSGLREQAHASWPRALAASLFLTKAAAGFARSTGDYERFAPDVARGYRLLGLPAERRPRRGRPAGAPLVGRPPRDRAGGRCRRPATRSPGSYAALYALPAGAGRRGRPPARASPPRSATVARRRIRTARRVPGAPTGPKSPGCFATRIAASTGRPVASLIAAAAALGSAPRPGAGRRPTTRPGTPRPRAAA